MISIFKKIKRMHKYRKLEFAPHYNSNGLLSTFIPEIYNKAGKRMDIFFLSDARFADTPYGFSQNFLWDRYNLGLKTHFYTHNLMLEIMGSPDRKYGWLVESEVICQKDYQIFDKNRGLEKDFDLIFTFSDKILQKFSNARFSPGNGAGNIFVSGLAPADGNSLKTKNISIISSNKSMCKLHNIRRELAKKLKKMGNVDTFGNFDGGARFDKTTEPLTEYRYSIALENEITPLYFTEKILNCFATMTVPIYIGATQIGNFFNTDGIIQLSLKDLDSIDKILAHCCEKNYFERISAIKDNYERVKKFFSTEEYIFENYLANDLQNKPPVM